MIKYMAAFIFYTLAMIGVIVIAFLVWKNSVLTSSSKKKGLMQIEDSLNLAPRKTLYVIKIADERFLIAADADKTVFLSKLNKDENIQNVDKYITENNYQQASKAYQIPDGMQDGNNNYETFSMRKLLNKLAKEDSGEA